MTVLENVSRILENGRWSRKVILDFLWAPTLQRFFAGLATRAGIQLRQEANRCNTITDYVNLAFNFSSTSLFSIAPIQVRKEVTELLQILAKNRVMRVLEIGTARGGMLFLLARVSSPEAVIISVDLPQGKFAGGWYPNWKTPLYGSFAMYQQKIYLVREDSHAPSTLQMIERILNGSYIDFLFIDGDHAYEGVKMDFLMYAPLVRKRGLIAFHDICNGSTDVGGVPQFWNEIKNAFKHQEIIGNHDQKGFGIGVLYN